MSKLIDITGRRFNRLVVIEKAPPDIAGTKFVCQCDCGVRFVTRSNDLRNGKTKSCGCLHREIVSVPYKHGDTGSKEHHTWTGMVKRCTNPNGPDWKNYGGRGIVVCDEWLNDYSAFLAYVGRAPSPDHTIDRYPDNNGNYEPGNVRWATRTEQANNKKR